MLAVLLTLQMRCGVTAGAGDDDGENRSDDDNSDSGRGSGSGNVKGDLAWLVKHSQRYQRHLRPLQQLVAYLCVLPPLMAFQSIHHTDACSLWGCASCSVC